MLSGCCFLFWFIFYNLSRLAASTRGIIVQLAASTRGNIVQLAASTRGIIAIASTRGNIVQPAASTRGIFTIAPTRGIIAIAPTRGRFLTAAPIASTRGRFLTATAVALTLTASAAAEDITLFTGGDTSGWEYQTFSDIAETSYRPAATAEGLPVLTAASDTAASGYTRQLELSLYETPWLHVRWRVNRVAATAADERTRAGDDFAWRLYFVGKSGLEYRALNLVYARQNAAGARWESPYAGMFRNIQLYALSAHTPDTLGQWQTSVINVGELWRDMFDDDGRVGLIGIMTDSDNAGGISRADYGEIILSAQPPSL